VVSEALTGARSRSAQKADTRRALLRAAEAVFLREDPGSARLDDVAAEAGVSKATLFFHFGNRAELLAAVAFRLYAKRASLVSASDAAGLRSYLTDYLDGMRLPDVRLIHRLGDLIADRPDLLQLAYAHLHDELRHVLELEGHDTERGREIAELLGPALLMVARRAATDLADEAEVDGFIAAALRQWGRSA
jgi:AcrR family transcriptional regulator